MQSEFEKSSDILLVHRIDVVEKIISRLGYTSTWSRGGDGDFLTMTATDVNYSIRLAEKLPASSPFNSGTRILVKTDDCLKSLYLLKKEKIDLFSTPYYSSEGLMAHFYDSGGNLYLLIEERHYIVSEDEYNEGI